MSKISIMLTGALMTMSACGVDAQSNYTVTYPVGTESDNTMAYLVDWDSAEKIDSVVVTDGAVKFQGHVDTPKIGRIVVNGKRGPVFFLEEGKISIGADNSLSGTPLNDKFKAGQERLTQLVSEFRTLDQNDSIQAERAGKIYQEYQSLPEKMYEENRDNLLGLYMYMQSAYEKPLAQLESDMKSNPVLAGSKQAQALCNTLRVQTETGEGKHYKDFTVEYDGKTEKLSDYVKPGRYTIVDFWASWCGPCVRQLKVIKELYAKYKDKGLDVVGVAVWDKPEDTVEAIKKHELPWPCIIDAQTIPTDLYGIQGIPCILLIGPDGVIVSRDKQGAALVNDVDEAIASFEVADKAEAAVTGKGVAETDTIAVF